LPILASSKNSAAMIQAAIPVIISGFMGFVLV